MYRAETKSEQPIERSKQERKEGIFRKIDKFMHRHPKLDSTVRAASIAILMLEGGKAMSGDGIYEHSSNKPPQVQDFIREQAPGPESRQSISELETEIGKSNLKDTFTADSIENIQERMDVEALPNQVQIFGFEKFIISNNDVNTIIEKTIPKGFKRNLNVIKYSDRHSYLNDAYGSKLVETRETAGFAKNKVNVIEIEKGAKQENQEHREWVVNQLITHELFHLQDWTNNSLLTVDERLELFKQVVDRVKASDRYKTDYVENIENDDKKDELNIKTKEYFAEIGATYLSKDYHLLPKADKKIIADLIKKVDPQFDRVKALNRREKIVGSPKPENLNPVRVGFEVQVEVEPIPPKEPTIQMYKEQIKAVFDKAGKEINEEQLLKEAESWYQDTVKRISSRNNNE